MLSNQGIHLAGESHQNLVLPPREEPEDPLLRLIRVEAPSFDGSHQPSDYLDWEASMDQYFDWYPMAEERKVRLAKMRLTKLAKTFWLNVENLRGVRCQEPIYIRKI